VKKNGRNGGSKNQAKPQQDQVLIQGFIFFKQYKNYIGECQTFSESELDSETGTNTRRFRSRS
jgi:hypothetical protein